MSNPINQLLFSQYRDFNRTFEAARFLHPEERAKVRQKLIGLIEEMGVNAHNATAFPGKIKTEDQFLQDLTAKISTLFLDEKGPSSFASRKPALSRPTSTKYVGFHNLGANCWVNALLQMLLHTPEGVAILRTVGQYYADGKDLDRARLPACIKYCEADIPLTEGRLEDAVKYFCAIHSGYQRLRALEALCRSKVNPLLIEHLLQFLPKQYREQLQKIRFESDLHGALNLLLANTEQAEIRRLKESRDAGQYLLDAVIAYNQALLNAEIHKTTPKAVPNSVSQKARLAFHHFFGIQNKGDRPVFSTSPDAHEDAYEGIQNLKGLYRSILEEEGTFPPKIYSETETRTRYEPVGEPRLLRKQRTQLEPGNILRKRSFDCQILVDAGERNGVSVEDLLKSHFEEPPILKPEDYPVFLAEKDLQQEQSYRPVEQQIEFRNGAPQTFTLVIKRFGLGVDGRPKKLETRVIANQVIILPASAFPADKCKKAYALESFFIHRGGSGFGHYIAYRKIDGKWVEFDDNKTRILSDAEIDRILQGRVSATFTPYALDYRLVPNDRQKELLRPTFLPDDNKGMPLPSAPPAPAPEEEIPLLIKKGASLPLPSAPPSHDAVMYQLSQLLVLLKLPSCTEEEIAQALTTLESLSPTCIKQLSALVAIRDGVKVSSKDYLCKNARKLVTPTASWIRTTSNSILEQYIQREKEKMPIVACRAELATMTILPEILQSETRRKEQHLTKQYRIANLRAFQALLKDESLTNDQLIAILNEYDLPPEIKDRMYAQIGAVLGASKSDAQRIGKIRFGENPRLLILPLQKKSGKLSMDTETSGQPSTTIIEETIATL